MSLKNFYALPEPHHHVNKLIWLMVVIGLIFVLLLIYTYLARQAPVQTIPDQQMRAEIIKQFREKTTEPLTEQALVELNLQFRSSKNQMLTEVQKQEIYKQFNINN